MPLNEQAKAEATRTDGGDLRRRVRQTLLGTAVAAALLACAPVIDNRGYIFDESQIETLQKGVTQMDTVRESFGSPSTVTSMNGNAYYYIYARFVTESYRAPEEVARKVLAIYFDSDKRVRDYAVYGLEDGIIVPIVQRTTLTQGQELSIIEQLFGNLGRFGDEAPGSEF